MRKLHVTIFCLLCFLLSVSHEVKGSENKQNFKYKLAACAIFRNEAPYLKEWIEFHRLVGIEHFYLYNNLSLDNYQEVLKPYIATNIVELIEWPRAYDNLMEWNLIQCEAYSDGIKQAAGISRWLAILDIDEYLFPVEKNSLVALLKDYKQFGGICVNWQMYGTSNVSKIPPNKLLIETLHRKAPKDFIENKHVKSIVQPLRVSECSSPHFFLYHPNFYQVNEYKEQFGDALSPWVSVDKMRVNHYWSRDEDYFNRFKVSRRESWSEPLDTQLNRLKILNSEADDRAIQRFVPTLRKKMGFA